MGKRPKKKRNKKYRPKDASGVEIAQPTIHRFVAEDENKVASRKKWKRRLILVAVIGLPLVLLLEILF